MFGADIGTPKAIALARNLEAHMIGGGVITALALPFDEALRRYPLSTDLIAVGVDNNACRWTAAAFARRRRIPGKSRMLVN
jgi:hypothetical protein